MTEPTEEEIEAAARAYCDDAYGSPGTYEALKHSPSAGNKEAAARFRVGTKIALQAAAKVRDNG